MPTQTYTPTATFHTTGSYQENGDVSDATILQNTGERAMDNVAYLNGGNTYTQVRQEATVADLAALKALTDQRDQDYFVLDSNKRKYQFDAASVATADDYAVVQPTAGAGRYILLASAVPQSTVLRRVVSAVVMESIIPSTGAVPPKTPANGRVSINGADHYFYAQFSDLNPGDVISSVEVCGNAHVGGGGSNIVATFYRYSCALAATTPTITALGVPTIAAGSGNTNQTVNAAPLPITIAAGDIIAVEVFITSGAPTTDYLYWVAINGTRSYITA